MRSSSDSGDDTMREWRHYAREMERAARAAAVATRYEHQLLRPPESMRPVRTRMATLHRQIEQRHLACARLFRLHALRLLHWRADGSAAVRPVFMAAVAEDLGLGSAAITLFDDQRRELLHAASDARSRAAHDHEVTIGQGPAREVAAGVEALLVEGSELIGRWPQYSTAATDLGIRSVVAVGVPMGPAWRGALCVYSERSHLPADAVPAIGRIAEVLATQMLPAGFARGVPRGALFDDADYSSTVNQAIGMVAVQESTELDTALQLLRARAFAEGISLRELSGQVVEEGYRLC
ncbi:hypothetical protein [Nocardia sp. NPDC051570]|uniref:hypothetical protein n=1 Tax=Nocardia sp. NPDC051570 TaxID=3364324 RepID=UPI00379F8328